MDKYTRNSQGCPLLDQTGEAAVRNFTAIVHNWPPELRQAFERERTARKQELKAIRAQADGGWLRRMLMLG